MPRGSICSCWSRRRCPRRASAAGGAGLEGPKEQGDLAQLARGALACGRFFVGSVRFILHRARREISYYCNFL